MCAFEPSRIFSYARTSRTVRFMQTEKSSYDESSKTYSTTKSFCGNWTNGSMRGGVHAVVGWLVVMGLTAL